MKLFTKYSAPVVSILGLIIFSIGLANLIAYWHGTEWQVMKYGITPMAVSTAFCFTVAGIAFLIIGKGLNEKINK